MCTPVVCTFPPFPAFARRAQVWTRTNVERPMKTKLKLSQSILSRSTSSRPTRGYPSRALNRPCLRTLHHGIHTVFPIRPIFPFSPIRSAPFSKTPLCYLRSLLFTLSPQVPAITRSNLNSAKTTLTPVLPCPPFIPWFHSPVPPAAAIKKKQLRATKSRYAQLTLTQIPNLRSYYIETCIDPIQLPPKMKVRR